MIVFQRILVAVDGSPASLHALKEAFHLGTTELAMITVAPAAGLGEGGEVNPELDAYWRDVQDRAQTQAAGLAKTTGMPLKAIAARGEPHECIVAAAASEGSDLVVVGLKGRDLPAAALMGSTTARVIGFSPQDVLVVPEHAGISLTKILLPTDGSRYSQKAAARALEICAACGSELEALSVLDAPPGFAEDAPEVAADLLARLKELTAGVKQRAERQGISCRAEVRQGPVYRVITDHAAKGKVSLIVMGSHGRTGLKRLLMGSVTERVIGFAPCPVVVVKGKI
jgi:nucleotide-binding universal stress UspA family protein